MATRKAKLHSLQTRAAIEPSSINVESRTAKVIWSSGAAVLRNGWDGPFYEELSMDKAHIRMDRLVGAPLLMNHDAWNSDSHVGVVESASIEAAQGLANVKFSARDDVKPIMQDVADGIRRQVSVGYRVYKYLEVPMGAEDKIPTFRAIDWEPLEISLVPIGADPGASVRGESAEEFEIEIESPTAQVAPIVRSSTMTPEEIKAQEDQKRAAELKASQEASVAAERKRAEDIRTCVRTAKLDEKLADEMIGKGLTIDAARAAVIDAMAKKQAEDQPNTRSQHVDVGQDEQDKFARGVGEWLIIRSGQAKKVEKHTGQKLDAGQFRGMSLLDLARESLGRSGVNHKGMDRHRIAELALSHRSSPAFSTTSDFPLILENTLHKLLMAAYAITPDTWTNFCRQGTVSDFRAHNRYQMGTFGALDTIDEHGEFKQKSIPDAEKQSITATTKGNIIGITREALVNDDMDAFSSLSMLLGRAAKLSIEMDVYALLALNAGLGPLLSDGQTLFHATYSNISTGAALSAAAIDLDRVNMASHTDVSGNEILDIRPQSLVVPIALGSTARSINTAVYDPDTANKLQKPNTVMGLFDNIVDTARMTGTRRYLFADPNVAPVLEVAFLDGVQDPYLAMEDSFGFNGVRWKVRIDYAVGAVGFRGAVTNAGT